jgi:plasmid stability protein
MADLTVSIDENLLERVRIRALEQDTSVDALVRDYLERLAGQTQPRESISALLALAERSASGSGPTGRTWKRDELLTEDLNDGQQIGAVQVQNPFRDVP